MEIRNPATGAAITDVPADTPDGIRAKFEAATAAQPQWAATPPADRIAALNAFAAALERDVDELAGILTDEMGKPLAQAQDEINATPDRVRFFTTHVAEVVRNESVLSEPGMTERISYDPLGVIANISAWNYPYFVGTNVLAPALLTGNAVLYKPSEFATLTGQAIVRLLHEAGVPEDALQLVVGGGSEGAELLKQPLDGVFFTGSYGTGRKIAQAAADHLMKVQLELGGKDPMYVCEDADPQQAAEGLADGAFYNTGQSCCAVERIYVHTDVYDAFVDRFVSTVRGFAIGNPRDADVYIGPLTRAEQLAVLEEQVRDGLEKGATVLCGGHVMDRPGSFFEPTVLTNVNHDMQVMCDESFGPIIGIQRVADDAEAVRLMQDTPYGLTAGVFTPDRERAESILTQMDSGTVYWNCCDRVSPRLPWSGRGHSGIGATLSLEGIRTFLRPKAWHLRG